jgi:FHS family L-fucose permease-like MFS transporter
MIVMTMLFFVCGFLATLNDILIPQLKLIFDLNYAKVMLVQFSFFSSFLLFSFPSGKLVEVAGYQRTLSVGLFTMSTGALLFIPAAMVPSFLLFMVALLVLAGGVTALQVSGNSYVSILGPGRTASSRLNLTQAFNSLGSTIAPYVGGLLLLNSASPTAVIPAVHGVEQAAHLRAPYLGIAFILFVLGCFVTWSRMPAIQDEQVDTGKDENRRSVWRVRHLVLGAVGIFLYCGAEIGIGGFLVNYIIGHDIGNMTARAASRYVSIYWGGSMLGRFIGSAILRKVRPGTLLGINATGALSLVGLSIAFDGHVAMWSILLVGIFNSIMFPTLFTLGIADLGPLTGKGSGMLMASAVGAAILPVLQGMVADEIGVHLSFIIPAVAYIYVAYYGFHGCQTEHGYSPVQIAKTS